MLFYQRRKDISRHALTDACVAAPEMPGPSSSMDETQDGHDGGSEDEDDDDAVNDSQMDGSQQ